jgi:alpha,alpha-trehalase
MSARVTLLGLLTAFAAVADDPPRTPAELYPGLFERVQLEQVYDDGKTFVDALPRQPPERIMEEYRRQSAEPGFELEAFVTARFAPPEPAAKDFRPDEARGVVTHIDALWPALTRTPDEAVPGASLLPLPHRYVVPGGRFREIYYWDSYFTMLGLEESGRHDLVVDMVRNFAFLIDRHGHVPNGNRSYYLSRSQPPFFSSMVELLAAREGSSAYLGFLSQLRREYDFWMDGADSLKPGEAHRRAVRLPDGALLNRYWDDRQTPREESWRADVQTAQASSRPAEDVYRNLRAAAESGWDFSSRWLADGRTLATIRTVELLPVDLNSLLYALEQTLARAYRAGRQPAEASRFEQRALDRRRAIHRYLWNERSGAFEDYDWTRGARTGQLTAATLYPLFTGLATAHQARDVAMLTEQRLLAPDGLATTLVRTGQQWDAPNGWAPLQWIAVAGLDRYGHRRLARSIAHRWIRENLAGFVATGRLVEKYDVSGDAAARGGEYPLQDGFGWTNGVLRRLLALYPEACAGSVLNPCQARSVNAPMPARNSRHQARSPTTGTSRRSAIATMASSMNSARHHTDSSLRASIRSSTKSPTNIAATR